MLKRICLWAPVLKPLLLHLLRLDKLTFTLILCFLFTQYKIVPAAIEIGSDTTQNPSLIADHATFAITQGTPAIDPAQVIVGQTATVRFRVTLSWPTTLEGTVQQQKYEITAAGDSTITSASASGCTTTIADDSHSAILSLSGGNNEEVLDITTNVSYASLESKLVAIEGNVTFSDGSTINDFAFTTFQVMEAGAVGSGTVLGGGTQTGTTDLSPELKRILSKAARKGSQSGLRQTLSRSLVYEGVGAAGASQVVIIAAGAVAGYDLYVYIKTGDSKLPFTRFGRWLAGRFIRDKIVTNVTRAQLQRFSPSGETHPPGVMTLRDIAASNAERNGTTTCEELARMLRLAVDLTTRQNLITARQQEGCYDGLTWEQRVTKEPGAVWRGGEKPIADYLAKLGFYVKKLKELNEVNQGQRTGDCSVATIIRNADPEQHVNSVRVEFKTVDPGATSNTLKTSIGSSLGKKGQTEQAREIIIDVRGKGLSKEEAELTLKRFANPDMRRVRPDRPEGKLDYLRIIGDGYDVHRRYR